MTDNQCTITDGLRDFSNRIIFEVAQEHGVRIVELVTAPLHKSRAVAAARHEVIWRMHDAICYSDPPKSESKVLDENRREYRLRNEVPEEQMINWNPVSTKDIARCLAANHSTIVLALGRRTNDAAEAEDAA